MPNPVINAKMRCSNAGCSASCLENFQFPDGELEVIFDCDDGEWFVRDSEFETVPACERKYLSYLTLLLCVFRNLSLLHMGMGTL